jgi:glutamyl-tRNA reductase
LAGQGVKRIIVANRTLEAASLLAELVGGEAVPFFSLEDALREVDVILCCTGAPHYVLTAKDIAQVIDQREGRPLVLIDVSVPRNIEPEVGSLSGVRLLDIDSLSSVADRNRSDRASFVPQVERLLGEEIAKFNASLHAYEAGPTIASLRHKIETLMEAELDRFRARQGAKFSSDQLEAVASLTRSIANKFLHEPTVILKAQSEKNSEHASVIRELFGLQGPGALSSVVAQNRQVPKQASPVPSGTSRRA